MPICIWIQAPAQSRRAYARCSACCAGVSARGNSPPTVRRRAPVRSRRSIAHVSLDVLFVLAADVVDQLGVELDELIQLDGPRRRVRLRIVDGQLDFEFAV